jgi:hypothetical protein
MSKWSEALKEYESAQKLASVCMKSYNPMTAKIKQAIIKIRMKVRNRVQLPSKLPLAATTAKTDKSTFSTKKGSYQTSKLQSSKIANQFTANSIPPSYNDFQNSVNSTKTADNLVANSSPTQHYQAFAQH